MVVRPIFSLVADWVALWRLKIAGEQKGGVRESRWARIRGQAEEVKSWILRPKGTE